MGDSAMLTKKLKQLWPHLNEKARRMVAATEAVQFGYGGITEVSRICGLSRVTITKGIAELKCGSAPSERIRRAGGGRWSLTRVNPELSAALEALVDPLSRGDPESPLRWTCKSTRTLASTLTNSGHQISHERVAQLLRKLKYSLQSNRKTEEGEDHPHRDAQFRHINREVQRGIKDFQPVISVDTKKKELIGNYRNSGQKWSPKGMGDKVQGHDFPGPDVLRAYPYGIYDLGRNCGFVNVGIESRHRGLCRCFHPRLVAIRGTRSLPSGPATSDHGRRWR